MTHRRRVWGVPQWENCAVKKCFVCEWMTSVVSVNTHQSSRTQHKHILTHTHKDGDSLGQQRGKYWLLTHTHTHTHTQNLIWSFFFHYLSAFFLVVSSFTLYRLSFCCGHTYCIHQCRELNWTTEHTHMQTARWNVTFDLLPGVNKFSVILNLYPPGKSTW